MQIKIYKKKYLLLLIIMLLPITANALPSFQDVKDSYKKSDALLLDRHGEVIHELRIDNKNRRLDWVSLNNISPALVEAVIQSEDKRFYSHSGVDWKAVSYAMANKITSSRPRGASTITMQFIDILNERLKSRRYKRSLIEKWTQIQDARALENSWAKEEILEAYLNMVSFRGEFQGISAASRGLLGKEPHGLSALESIVLAALIRSPNASSQAVAKRGCLLKSALKLDIDCKEIDIVTKSVLSGRHFVKPKNTLAPHVALQLLKTSQGQTGNEIRQVYSTIDAKLQIFASELLRQHLSSLKSQNVRDGAILVVDNKAGDILAYVGSSGDLSSAPLVDGVKARRQAGSALKPFIYGLAIEKRLLTAASIIDDTPLDIPVINGIYRPMNYDSQFSGLVTLRTALASSLNVPAVKTLQIVGIESFLQRLKKLGFRELNEVDDFYGPSLALGAVDINLFEIVNAYRTLVNNGMWSEIQLTRDTNAKKPMVKVFSREAAFIISDILSDREARSKTFGMENPLSTRFWTAVKTGTSKDMRDNWCIGYSNKYTVGVWVGNFSGEPMWNVSGITGAAPLWIGIMNYLHKDIPSRHQKNPSNVVAANTGWSGKREWFIKGTEPDVIKMENRYTDSKIIYPASGMIIALDPDIPFLQQKVFFESQVGKNKFAYLLDGEKVGTANDVVAWIPHAGRHVLQLADEEKKIIDTVRFEVRGSMVN